MEKTHELIDAATCSSETKAAAESWLAAVGTDREAEETKNYVAELEEDIMPIDTLIAFSRIRRRSAGFWSRCRRCSSPRKRNQVCGSKLLRLPSLQCCG